MIGYFQTCHEVVAVEEWRWLTDREIGDMKMKFRAAEMSQHELVTNFHRLIDEVRAYRHEVQRLIK